MTGKGIKMDKQKADRIITEYFHKIYGFAMKKAFSYDEAEDLCGDIVQEVYISLLKAGEIFNLEGYIWRISENTFSRYVSSKRRRQGISIDGGEFMDIPFYEDYDSLLENYEKELTRLRREIAFLTKQRRKIVYLYYYENRAIAKISQQLNMPEGTVKWHLNKARKELKEGFSMERTIGKLGISPVTAHSFGHSGDSGNGDTEFYLGDKLNLNIVYSVYFSPKTTEEIAEELGITPVFIEDKIRFLEANGFLVRISGKRFTTYVRFSPLTYSLEQEEQKQREQMKIARLLVEEYVPAIRKAVADIHEVYIPGGNREILEAAAVLYGITKKGGISTSIDLSRYYIKPTTGGNYIAYVYLEASPSDPEYKATLNSYDTCGEMNRMSEKYPSVSSWSVDTKYCSRLGGWKNNLDSDYEYLYEFINGSLANNSANADKFRRLRERRFLTEDNQVNIMLLKMLPEEFFGRIPPLQKELKDKYANHALEAAMEEAKAYPPQMQDMIISWSTASFIGNTVAVMALDILYGNGTFRPLTEKEKVTSQLIMFSDILP